MHKLIAIFILTGIGLALSACNTMEGMGQDIQAGGNAVERGADNARPSGVDPDDRDDYR